MIVKLIIDCSSGEDEIKELTPKEIQQLETDMSAKEERDFIDSLLPHNDEVREAEIELKTLETLMEVGLI